MKNIVCFESSDYVFTTISKALKDENTTIIQVKSAKIGLPLIYETLPDIILLNPILEDIGGVSLLNVLKYDNYINTIPVILYSIVVDSRAKKVFEEADILLHNDKNFIPKLKDAVNKLSETEQLLYSIEPLDSKDVPLKIDEAIFYGQIKSNLLRSLLLISKNIDNPEILLEKLKLFFKDNFSIDTITGTEQLEITHSIIDEMELKCFNFSIETAHKFISQSLLIEKTLGTVDNLNRLFANYLPKKVISDLIKRDGISSLMTGEKRNITVLFSHIREFSVIEHKNNVEDIVSFLNAHFTGLSNGITEFGGEINKFIGDAIFAMFGAPVSYDNNEFRAVKAAMVMIEFIKNMKNPNISYGEAGYRIGIGIHIGNVIIGNIGSNDNLDFTAIGDTINLAARLESLCKYYDKDILVSKEVMEGCRRQKLGNVLREIDTVMVKGKNKSTTIYSIEDLSAYKEGFIDSYNKGLKMFQLGNWITAKEYFASCNNMHNDDKIILIYLDRCNKYLDSPPKKWTGAVVLDFK